MRYAAFERMKWLFLTTVIAAASSSAAACGNNERQNQVTDPPDAAPASSPSCTAIDASACEQPMPSYASDVAPLLNRACNSTCHAPGVGPWPLNNYTDVFDWGSIIAGDIEQCTMPPADAGAGNGPLTDPERALILDWLACGAPNN